MDDLIRPREHGGRDGEAEGLSGLHVDDELELRRPLDGEIRRLVGEGIIRAPPQWAWAGGGASPTKMMMPSPPGFLPMVSMSKSGFQLLRDQMLPA